MADLNEIADQLSSLTVMEAAELASLLEDKWGVSAAAPVAVAAAAAPGEVAAEEQTEFEVILIGFGDKKIQVIKEIRGITSLGLKEAKELVEGVPKVIKEGIAQDEANEIKEKIEGAGGQVDIK
ncbi:MAG: 50S ribosomal protein L7/L12 [Myxococcota bacterium]